ncbi:hypothetical protein HanRHA438_Chr14g0645291 [Helianthus annuus]|uniref:Uncharacterized protein n=1 Tax=Helianthus annuus TaxID=4232 RepID=A0A251SH44_HELAN|nr:hypothetical protein HanXRQr2_Chr14g0634551 [Helianthus annuus]KAJ0463582.1 hypothetical protein HanHA300_Chr14g0517281 [Helianthus annuus]KAJ0466400.1 hypothetical protein HanIR_Chr14g0671721 [Helianthus annuus]KAJ0467731.1 hypothetical protein HanIR_Chr14g0688501 [Helianthus annuus]KAJ0485055.1 hypothetical protein HanHA89_Chr14g0563841 [Helianthus annuus]
MLVSASIRGRDAGSSQRVRPRSTTGQTELTRSTPESTQVNRRSTEVNSVNECFSCTLASSHSWNYITETHLASFAQECPGCILQTTERLE